MLKMKSLLLSIGTVAITSTPLIFAISCSEELGEWAKRKEIVINVNSSNKKYFDNILAEFEKTDYFTKGYKIVIVNEGEVDEVTGLASGQFSNQTDTVSDLFIADFDGTKKLSDSKSIMPLSNKYVNSIFEKAAITPSDIENNLMHDISKFGQSSLQAIPLSSDAKGLITSATNELDTSIAQLTVTELFDDPNDLPDKGPQLVTRQIGWDEMTREQKIEQLTGYVDNISTMSELMKNTRAFVQFGDLSKDIGYFSNDLSILDNFIYKKDKEWSSSFITYDDNNSDVSWIVDQIASTIFEPLVASTIENDRPMDPQIISDNYDLFLADLGKLDELTLSVFEEALVKYGVNYSPELPTNTTSNVLGNGKNEMSFIARQIKIKGTAPTYEEFIKLFESVFDAETNSYYTIKNSALIAFNYALDKYVDPDNGIVPEFEGHADGGKWTQLVKDSSTLTYGDLQRLFSGSDSEKSILLNTMFDNGDIDYLIDDFSKAFSYSQKGNDHWRNMGDFSDTLGYTQSVDTTYVSINRRNSNITSERKNAINELLNIILTPEGLIQQVLKNGEMPWFRSAWNPVLDQMKLVENNNISTAVEISEGAGFNDTTLNAAQNTQALFDEIYKQYLPIKNVLDHNIHYESDVEQSGSGNNSFQGVEYNLSDWKYGVADVGFVASQFFSNVLGGGGTDNSVAEEGGLEAITGLRNLVGTVLNIKSLDDVKGTDDSLDKIDVSNLKSNDLSELFYEGDLHNFDYYKVAEKIIGFDIRDEKARNANVELYKFKIPPLSNDQTNTERFTNVMNFEKQNFFGEIRKVKDAAIIFKEQLAVDGENVSDATIELIVRNFLARYWNDALWDAASVYFQDYVLDDISFLNAAGSDYLVEKEVEVDVVEPDEDTQPAASTVSKFSFKSEDPIKRNANTKTTEIQMLPYTLSEALELANTTTSMNASASVAGVISPNDDSGLKQFTTNIENSVLYYEKISEIWSKVFSSEKLEGFIKSTYSNSTLKTKEQRLERFQKRIKDELSREFRNLVETL